MAPMRGPMGCAGTAGVIGHTGLPRRPLLRAPCPSPRAVEPSELRPRHQRAASRHPWRYHSACQAAQPLHRCLPQRCSGHACQSLPALRLRRCAEARRSKKGLPARGRQTRRQAAGLGCATPAGALDTRSRPAQRRGSWIAETQGHALHCRRSEIQIGGRVGRSAALAARPAARFPLDPPPQATGIAKGRSGACGGEGGRDGVVEVGDRKRRSRRGRNAGCYRKLDNFAVGNQSWT